MHQKDLGPNIWYPTWYLYAPYAEMKVSMIYTAFNGIYRAFNGIYRAFNGIYRAFNGIYIWLVVFRHPSKKYEFVSWDDYSQYMEKTCSKPPTSTIVQYREKTYISIELCIYNLSYAYDCICVYRISTRRTSLNIDMFKTEWKIRCVY